MLLCKKRLVLFLVLFCLAQSMAVRDHDDDGHEDHDGHDDHDHGEDDHDDDGHTGHDHTGQPHGHGNIDQNCPEDQDGDDHVTHEPHGGDHPHDDEDEHGHHDDDPHDHEGHGHEGWDGKEGACPVIELHFDEKDTYYEIMEKSPELTNITLCTYITTDNKGVARGVIASIQTDKKNKNLIIQGGIQRRKPFIRFSLEGQRRTFNTNFQPNAEAHMCMVSSVSANTVQIFIDGEKVPSILQFRRLQNIPAGGTVRIGMGKDDKLPMYEGTIKDWILWGKMLTDEEIKKIYAEDYCPGEALIVPLDNHVVPLKANVPTEACPEIEYTFDNMGDKVEYLELSKDLPTMEYLTVCVQVMTNMKGIIPGTIASYGTKNQPEILSVGGEVGDDGKAYTRFVVAGQTKLIDGQFRPNTEYRFCMVYHLPHNHLMTYINGVHSITTMFDDVDQIPDGGTTLIGQRQRKLGGCFDRDLAYNGKMEDFMIWTRALSNDEIKAYAMGNCPTDVYTTTKRQEVVPHGRFYAYSTCPTAAYTLKNDANTVEYLRIKDTFPESEYLTFCAQVETNEKGMIPGVVGSYYTESMKQSLVVGGLMEESGPRLLITLNGDMKILPGQYAPNKEYQFCISFHIPHGHVLTYINGQFVKDIFFEDAKAIPGGGTIIIGQSQGCLGSCFDRDKAYNGKLSNVMVWNRVLATEEMAAIASSNECPTDLLIDLTSGNVEEVSITSEDSG